MNLKSLEKKLNWLTLSNAKTPRGQSQGYVTGILYLAPAWESGVNLCAKHSTDCARHCIFWQGRGRFAKVRHARLRRTNAFLADQTKFTNQLEEDVQMILDWTRANHQLNFRPAIRLNGTSDIRWERQFPFSNFPTVQFYDYTKLINRKGVPPNYHLTFSWSGDNLAECQTAWSIGQNVAVPFRKLPAVWQNHRVIDGDETDLRFLDPFPCVVGLKAKGSLRNAQSTFLGDT